jgi:S-adenosylmethionine:tRNA ribosyltransferase-isomerase
MHPRHISIHDFDYTLPQERIAQYPLEQRDASKLLVNQDGEMRETVFRELAGELPANSLLVFNQSKVIEARLLFAKPTGGIIEIFALEPHEIVGDITTAMNTQGSILYKCLVGGASKWKHGYMPEKRLTHEGREVCITARMAERRSNCFVIEFTWTPTDLPFAGILHLMGEIPIPPYLHRKTEDSDTERYQTVYAKAEGSVAAPTAGLHFTSEVLAEVATKGVTEAFVTLHVGAGTFMPVKSETMEGHEMHAEFLEVSLAFVDQLQQFNTVVAVGTTSCRTLESLYWMGLKALLNPSISLADLEVKQWEVYDSLMARMVPRNEALAALAGWMRRHAMQALVVRTQIIIAPGYPFQVQDALITNYHMPQSTLLLLIASFIGDDWRRVYTYALAHDFRFLSYGDSSLLWRR